MPNTSPPSPTPTTPRGLHLFVLAGFAFAQPLYDVLGRNAEFFVMRRAGLVEGLALVVMLSLALPLLLWTLTKTPRLGRTLHTVFVGLLVFFIAMHVVRRFPLAAWAMLTAATTLSGLFLLAYQRWTPTRWFVSALAPAIVVFPGLFLLNAQVRAALVPPPPAAVPSTAARAIPVVMVVFDEFPLISLLDGQRNLDAARFPHFAALAREATWYRGATTVHPWTQQAVPALLTGNFGNPDKLPTQADYPTNLFTLLMGSHDLHVQEAATQLCPAPLARREDVGLGRRLCTLFADLALVHLHLWLPPAWAEGLPPINTTWKDFGLLENEDRPRQIERFISALQPGTKPGLHFLHVELPHYPWCFLPSGHAHGRGVELTGLSDEGVWTSNADQVRPHHLRHLLQVGYVDHVLGRIVAQLKAAGMYDDAMLIVTADHGISFRPGDHHRAVTHDNFPDILRIPLFIRQPRQREGVIDDRAALAIDVLPTIAATLGLPWEHDGGVPLQGGLPPARGRPFFDKRQAWDFSHLADNFGSLPEKVHLLEVAGPCGIHGWARGRDPELLGRPWKQCALGPPTDFSTEVDHPEALRRVDLDSDFLPGILRGRVQGLHKAGRAALALNGVIWATFDLSLETRDQAWTAFTLAEAWQQGDNHLELFWIEDQADQGKRLHPIALKNLDPVSKWHWGNGRLVDPDHQPIPIVARSVVGCVDPVRPGHGCVEIAGWALNGARTESAAQVLVLVEGKVVSSQTPTLPRPDVALALGPGTPASCGFHFLLPADQIQGMNWRCFAVSAQGQALELRIGGSR